MVGRDRDRDYRDYRYARCRDSTGSLPEDYRPYRIVAYQVRLYCPLSRLGDIRKAGVVGSSPTFGCFIINCGLSADYLLFFFALVA